jgi:LuxR family maltose regulon positive regulatory protein
MRSSMLYAMVYIGDFSALRETLAELTDQQRAASEIREVAAALALAEGDTEAALSELAPVLVGEVDVDRRIVQIRSHLLQAHALYALHQSTAAQDAVEQALELAQTDGLVLPFMFTHARELLERHPRHRTAHGAFMAEILDAFSGDLPAADSEQPARPRDELSDAELRVLGYLPTNLSAAAIASEIYLSMNTVKTHMRHIYAKLDVHSRREAVARARELGLLGHSARQI